MIQMTTKLIIRSQSLSEWGSCRCVSGHGAAVLLGRQRVQWWTKLP